MFSKKNFDCRDRDREATKTIKMGFWFPCKLTGLHGLDSLAELYRGKRELRSRKEQTLSTFRTKHRMQLIERFVASGNMFGLFKSVICFL